MRRCTCSVLIALCSLVALRPAILAQHDQHDPGPLPKYVSEPIALFKVGLGPFTRKISTSNAEAQAFFDQGFQMMYAFAKLDAVRSFREAWKRDPELRDLLLGRGLGLGLVPERPDVRRAVAVRLCRDAEGGGAQGQGLADRARVHRRARRSATCRTSTSRHASSRTRRTPRRCARCTRRIRTISTPARSTPTRCSCSSRAAARATSTRRTSSGCTACSRACWPATRITRAPATSTCTPPNRPCGPTRRKRARSSSASSIPGASHINHMPSHTFNEVGRWGDSVRANLEAWHSDLKADAGEGFAIYPDHNLHMLLYAASMDGQGAIATQAGKDYASARATRCTRC